MPAKRKPKSRKANPYEGGDSLGAEGDPITRIHALFGVFRYARLLSSPPTATDADSNATVMTDWRIVRVTGPLVHSDILSKVLWFVGESIEGVHVKTIPIASSGFYGMAVNTAETLVVVSCSELAASSNASKLYLHSLPGGELLRTIGEEGTGPGQFDNPRHVCFGRDDVIIAADRNSNRLQEFTSTLEYKRSIAVTDPVSLCLSGSMGILGVGCYKTVLLLDYGSGAVIRSLAGGLSEYVTGVRFTLDDTHILAIAWDMRCVKMFSVVDGSFVRNTCRGLLLGHKDLCFAASGDIVVSDPGNYRVCVFTPDGSTLKRQFGSEGTGDGQFKYPTALSLVNGRLYVLDDLSPRVQVFQ